MIRRRFYNRVPFIIMPQNTSASDSYSQIVSALWNNGSVRLCHRPPSSLRHVSSFSTPSPLDETTIVYPWQQHHQHMVPKRVKIVEVGPRDGLQNESTLVSTPDKLSFIHKLIQAHISCIEITSFVSPKWVPSMADASEIVQGIQSWRRPTTSNDDDDSTFMVLVPNLQGLQNALNAGGIDQIAVFTSASEAFSQRNINCRYVYIRVLDVG